MGGFWAFGTHSRKILEMLGMISPCWGRFSKMDPRADPRSVTMRGGPSPSVVRPCLLRSLGRRPYRVGFAGPSGSPDFLSLGAKLAPSSHFFAICLHFFRTMLRSCVFYRFLMVFEWILEGLGKVPGVFWRWFFTRFSKSSVFPSRKLINSRVLDYEKSMKKQRKFIQISR